MKAFFRLFFWAYIIFILWVSLSPSTGVGRIELYDSSFRIDYLLHALVFMLLPIIGFFANGKSGKNGYWLTLIGISFALAIGTEYLQKFISERVFNPLDILSNVIGLILGITFVKYYLRKRYLKSEY